MTPEQAKRILNIEREDDKAVIRRKYHRLMSAFHPDAAGVDKPEYIRRAQEINAAYDTIQKQRGSRAGPGQGYARQSYGGYQYQSWAGAESSAFEQVRVAVNRNDLAMAEQLLAQIEDHNGEWNFLKGTICYRRGWVDEARRYYQTACQMDPGNLEYRQALNFVENGGASYRPEGYNVFSTGCTGGNLCLGTACTYFMCNLCGYCGMRFICC